MVVVARYITSVAVYHLAGGVTEGVPDAAPAAVFRDGALDLVAGGGRAPNKPFRKSLGHVVRSVCVSVTIAFQGMFSP